ncbi:ABC transporter permease [Gordonia sp. NPDC127522]|uniref:ABC transporter permease n=1 Tax=Gordonia sp. NPDC127522 TaxID=3345390 RepID=UPI003633E2DF
MTTSIERADTDSARNEQPGKPGVMRLLHKYPWVPGLVLAVLLVAFFSWQLPDTYPTWENLRSVIDQQVGLLVLALGVTIVLLIGEFDLSFSSTIGLSGAVGILSMTAMGWPTGVAILAAIAVGVIVGLLNGLAVTYGRAPAFIATLAIGFIATGVERLLTDDKTISEGVTSTYTDLTLERTLGFPLSTWLALALVVVVGVALGYTTYGRRVRATGMNRTAVRLAGISVPTVRISAFVILGLFAGIVGVFLTSQGGSSFPNSGTGLLLPPYAAVFLGAALVGRGRFSVLATVYGVFFIAALETGLVMMNKPGAVIQLIEGGVLIAAVILARQEQKV